LGDVSRVAHVDDEQVRLLLLATLSIGRFNRRYRTQRLLRHSAEGLGLTTAVRTRGAYRPACNGAMRLQNVKGLYAGVAQERRTLRRRDDRSGQEGLYGSVVVEEINSTTCMFSLVY
jgi:hypothetical protein